MTTPNPPAPDDLIAVGKHLKRITGLLEIIRQDRAERKAVSAIRTPADIEVVFNEKFGVAVEQQLIDLKVVPPEIHGYEVEGILHAIDDQDYTKPTGSVLVKVESHDGDWYCEINKAELAVYDLNDIWKKRIFAKGFATFRPRKRTLRVDSFTILPDKPSLVDAVDKFIQVNQEMWEGVDPTEYLDSVRERNLE